MIEAKLLFEQVDLLLTRNPYKSSVTLVKIDTKTIVSTSVLQKFS